MRNATILVVNLRGVATEIIKNIVLAGIGKLLVVDDQDVSEEDLGAGFFFTDDDVGKKVCARARCPPLCVMKIIFNFLSPPRELMLRSTELRT